MLLSLEKLPNIITEFAESRLLPVAPPVVQFMIGGALPLVLTRTGEMLAQYSPVLKAIGILTEQNKIDVEKSTAFIRNGFTKSTKFQIMNFTFDKNDGEFLIGLMEKYKDD